MVLPAQVTIAPSQYPKGYRLSAILSSHCAVSEADFDAMVYDEFPNLAARYKDCDSPPAVLQALFGTNPEWKALFLELFERTVRMLQSRSNDVRLITVYDKVLLSATKNGENLEDPGALTLYLEAYYGIDKDDPFEDVAETLEKELAIKALLLKVTNPSLITPSQDIAPPQTLPSQGHSHPSFEAGYAQAPYLPAKPPASTHYSNHRVSHRPSRLNLSTNFDFPHYPNATIAATAATGPPIRPCYISPASRCSTGPSSRSLDRLWSLYVDAKNEYLSAPSTSPPASINVSSPHTFVDFNPASAKNKAARFLRDTAENTLHELQNNSKFMMIDAAVLDDLRATFEEARRFVERISGGKKRKFDEEESGAAAASTRGGEGMGISMSSTRRPRSEGDLANAYDRSDRRRIRSLGTRQQTMGRYGVETLGQQTATRRERTEKEIKGRKRQRPSSGGYQAADRYRPGED